MKQYKSVVLFLLISMDILSAKAITIAVAANVGYAIEDLKKAFQKIHPETKVTIILGSSGKLTAQIRHGAPFGLFLSADMQYPHVLYRQNIALDKPVVYAQGALALFSVKSFDLTQGLVSLTHKNIHKIAMANPKTAPYGIAAKEALENAKLYTLLKEKIVYGESISQTVSYTITATDVGLVAKSSLFSPSLQKYKEHKNWEEIDTKLYTPINQGMVMLKNAKESAEIKTFYDFMLSPQAKKILTHFGYKVN